MWCEVAATMIYLKDFIPTVRRPNTTPHEDWKGSRPDISHLRPFGCTAYAKIPIQLSGGKLEARFIKCALIGYFGRDAYRLLDRSTGWIYRSRDVIFEEGLGHCTLPPVPGSANEGEDEMPDLVVLEPEDDEDAPATRLVPAQTEANPPQIPSMSTIPTPQTLRQSTRNSKPSPAAVQSRASEDDVEHT